MSIGPAPQHRDPLRYPESFPSDALAAVDLFAGAGGLSTGFAAAGIRTVLANELHGDASKTYERNHPTVDLVTRDVHDLRGAEILARASTLLGRRLKKGDIDIIAGGPPCQGFSFAGLKEADDPRNNLVWEQLRLVEELQPKFVLIENVEGMAKLHGGKLPDEVVEELGKLGYRAEYRLLFAAQYGVPQQRKRLIFLANRVGAPIKFPRVTHYSPDDEDLSRAPRFQQPDLFAEDSSRPVLERYLAGEYLPYVTVGHAISDLDFLEAGESADEYRLPAQSDFQRLMREDATKLFNHQATKHGARTIEYFSYMVPGGSIETIPERLLTKKTGIQRWHPDRVSRAVVTAFEDFVHYRAHRIPTVREVARLQTFPDRFEFMGQRTAGNQNRRHKYSSQTQQVSNAVPPRLAQAIGLAIQEVALSTV
jgi:DNA (cytosine-5)-methyltransferase 1